MITTGLTPLVQTLELVINPLNKHLSSNHSFFELDIKCDSLQSQASHSIGKLLLLGEV